MVHRSPFTFGGEARKFMKDWQLAIKDPALLHADTRQAADEWCSSHLKPCNGLSQCVDAQELHACLKGRMSQDVQVMSRLSRLLAAPCQAPDPRTASLLNSIQRPAKLQRARLVLVAATKPWWPKWLALWIGFNHRATVDSGSESDPPKHCVYVLLG